jgi:hypothetical protein
MKIYHSVTVQEFLSDNENCQYKKNDRALNTTNMHCIG